MIYDITCMYSIHNAHDMIYHTQVGTEFANVEWVRGNLKDLPDLAPAMKGVKKVVFAPLLATRAGSDPTYFEAAVYQDIEMNRVVYAEGITHLFTFFTARISTYT